MHRNVNSDSGHKMYRSESFQGSGKRDAVSVLTYEFSELGNRDAVEYITEHYLSDRPDLRQESERLDLYSNENTVRTFFENALDEVKNQTGIDVKYVLWLTDYETAKNFYASDPDEPDLEEFNIDGGVILSDLGTDGMLFGFAELPTGKWVDPDEITERVTKL